MQLELNQPFDVCVIGAGPAGIIVALEYSKLNPTKTICLVEYGHPNQKERNSLDDSIQVNNPINHHDPYECTNKGLGGSSQTWGGRCVMYDKVDFISRPVVNDGCTWDTGIFEDVKKYLFTTTAYFECGKPVFNLENDAEFKLINIADGFIAGDVTDKVVERWSMPTNFGKRYASEIAANKQITLIQGYEARSFSKPDTESKVGGLTIRNVQTSIEECIQATQFVVAAGTQETTRLLLRNKDLFSELEKGVPSALGKYYQGHVSGKIASVKLYGDPKNTIFSFLRDKEGVYIRKRLQFTSDFLTKNNLLNTAIWLDNPLYYNYRHRSGAMSFMYLAMIMPVLGKKLAPPAIRHSITNGEVANIGHHIWNVLKDLPGSLIKPATIFYKRYCLARKLPGIFLYSPKNTYALHFHAEQVPCENNKMTLAADGETLIIDYSLVKDDVDSVIKIHKALDEYLRKTGCGELEYWYPENELGSRIRQMSCDGIHQSGTTRIAETPELGVVDKNLKLWGTENVYICSSSVFPTSGQANPTFFLGAFAVRLANHLTI